jgi:endonuclease/exonuclease/phosphatase family metal-dependent hydrolase
MKTLFAFAFFLLIAPPGTSSRAFGAPSLVVYDQNVFDQLQGDWKPDFRGKRMDIMAGFVKEHRPDIVVFEEARGEKNGKDGGGDDSVDSEKIRKDYPYRKYLHEMTGADGASYGYWIGAKKKPDYWVTDEFSFPGGVPRKVLAAVWKKWNGGECLGVTGLHLSYQTSEVRQREAAWLLNWLRGREKSCKHWLVMGDMNASEKDPEMKVLFDGGLKPLFKEPYTPTVGPYNPIRAIYGKDKPNLTIDWALGWNLAGDAQVVLNEANKAGDWVSDHAGVLINLKN